MQDIMQRIAAVSLPIWRVFDGPSDDEAFVKFGEMPMFHLEREFMAVQTSTPTAAYVDNKAGAYWTVSPLTKLRYAELLRQTPELLHAEAQLDEADQAAIGVDMETITLAFVVAMLGNAGLEFYDHFGIDGKLSRTLAEYAHEHDAVIATRKPWMEMVAPTAWRKQFVFLEKETAVFEEIITRIGILAIEHLGVIDLDGVAIRIYSPASLAEFWMYHFARTAELELNLRLTLYRIFEDMVNELPFHMAWNVRRVEFSQRPYIGVRALMQQTMARRLGGMLEYTGMGFNPKLDMTKYILSVIRSDKIWKPTKSNETRHERLIRQSQISAKIRSLYSAVTLPLEELAGHPIYWGMDLIHYNKLVEYLEETVAAGAFLTWFRRGMRVFLGGMPMYQLVEHIATKQKHGAPLVATGAPYLLLEYAKYHDMNEDEANMMRSAFVANAIANVALADQEPSHNAALEAFTSLFVTLDQGLRDALVYKEGTRVVDPVPKMTKVAWPELVPTDSLVILAATLGAYDSPDVTVKINPDIPQPPRNNRDMGMIWAKRTPGERYTPSVRLYIDENNPAVMDIGKTYRLEKMLVDGLILNKEQALQLDDAHIGWNTTVPESEISDRDLSFAISKSMSNRP